MADEQREDEQRADEGGSQSSTGDPGRTPDKAEGSEETVEESLNEKGNG